MGSVYSYLRSFFTSGTTSTSLETDRTAIFSPSPDAIQEVLRRMDLGGPLQSCGRRVPAKCELRDLGDGRLVKSGHTVSLAEARAMVFIRERTSIPVPKITMVFTYDSVVHIVMELVEGITLTDAVLRKLISSDDLHTVVVQLRDIIDTIRALGRCTAHTEFGSWPIGPYTNTYFCDLRPAGPFHSVDEFHAYWLKVVDNTKYMADKPVSKALQDVARRDASSTATKAGPVLTHGDLAPRNIIVRNGLIVAVLDWEAFGWYPEFWETMGLRNGGLTVGLKSKLREVFGEEPDVAATYRYILASLDSPQAHYR
ncbi:kinase-like domain-containing protein [Amylostereum chailletii]|nr:kinase-like domain-containing protein [Amylostereum chailletii]